METSSSDSKGGMTRARSLRGLQATAVMAVLLVAVPVLALLVWTAVQLRQAVREDVAIKAQAMIGLAARQQESLLANAHGLLAALAQLPRLQDEAGQCHAVLKGLLADRTGYVNFGVIDANGRVRCSALPFEPGLNLADRDYFRRALEGNHFAAGVYQVGRITGAPSINFGYPIRDAAGQPIAVVFAAVDTAWFASLVDAKILPAGSTVTLLDHGLRVLAQYPTPAGGQATGHPSPYAKAVDERALAGQFVDREPGGDVRLHAYTRLDGGAVRADAPYLMVDLPLGSVQARFEWIVLWQIGGVAVALIVLASAGWLMMQRRVLAPARLLAVAAGRLAKGESGVRLGATGGAAELVHVAAAFNDMAARTDAAIRALTVLSAGNRSLLYEQDEQALLEAMCRVAVEVGGYRHAWVAYVGEEGVQRRAAAGDDGGFADYLQAHWDTARTHQTPTARAIASGEPVVMHDASRAVGGHDLFEAAAQRGLLAGLVLPLKVDGSVLGALTIYAAQADAFGPREVELLSELAEDLAFGIATARLRERYRLADTELRRLAYFDVATGVRNRAGFLKHLPVIQGAGEGGLAVLVVDLHNYWELAATLGHSYGEAFLNVVAGRLQAQSPALLARVAQSEFALALLNVDEAAACRSAEQVLASLAPPAMLSPVSVDIDATVGIAVGGRRRRDGERLLQAARLAAHEVATGTSRLLLARPELEKEWSERLTLVADLRSAIDSHALDVHAQPQLDLRTGRICGMEALARWQHPFHGNVPPGKFIGLAEQTGLIRSLTYAVLEAVRELAQRHADAGLLLPIAVNISARNLHDPDFVSRVTEFLGRWPLPADCLHLELTETAVMEDPLRSLQALHQLHELGLPIYLDDFGSGYSSMAYLRELPLRGLKIDRAFIVGLAQPGTRRIVQTMIELGHALGLTVVAEGVEDPATLDILDDLGCNIAQGYIIARPMPNAELAGWITRWSCKRMARAPNEDVRS